jgi:hypothetical protein
MFITRLRVQLRFGRLSRAPLRLLRLEWRGDHVDGDWIARLHDEWDEALPRRLSDGNATLQALEDAIVVRELLFYALHDISSATFRVYRQVADEPPELIITGTGHETGTCSLERSFSGDASKAVWISFLSR